MYIIEGGGVKNRSLGQTPFLESPFLGFLKSPFLKFLESPSHGFFESLSLRFI